MQVAWSSKFEKEFIAQTGVKLIVKAVWVKRTEEGCAEHKALHRVFPAGCAVVAAVCVKKLKMPLPMLIWDAGNAKIRRVKEFGLADCFY